MSQSPTLGFGCAICSDAFDVNSQRNICTIPSCGHVYHEYCLKRWFRTQIQQLVRSSCPKCRVPATANQVIRLFLHQTISEDNEDNDTTTQEVDEDEDIADLATPDQDSVEIDYDSDYVNDDETDDVPVDLTFSDDEDSMPNSAVPNFNTPQHITLSGGNYENDADLPAELIPPSYAPYPSLFAHANELYALDQRLQSLRMDLSAMIDMVNGLESYVETLNEPNDVHQINQMNS